MKKTKKLTKQDFIVMLLAMVTSSFSWIANVGE